MVEFDHKQVMIDPFKRCELIVLTDGGENLLIRRLKPNQASATDLVQPKVLHYVAPQERHDPSETFEGLKHTYSTKRPIVSDHYLGKKLNKPSAALK